MQINNLRINCFFFFSFPCGMNEKTDVPLYDGRSPPYENVHVGFSFIPQGNEKIPTVNSYNLISYHFHK